VIKGSEQAIKSDSGYMDRVVYVDGTTSTTSGAFSTEADRHAVYDLFERYRSLLLNNQEHDVADR
jgi:hypothetical protein